VLASVGSVGDAYDNALAESFVDSFKTELIADRVWRSRSQLELAVVEYIGWFNHDRLHEALADVPPAEFEQRHAAKAATSGNGSDRSRCSRRGPQIASTRLDLSANAPASRKQHSLELPAQDSPASRLDTQMKIGNQLVLTGLRGTQPGSLLGERHVQDGARSTSARTTCAAGSSLARPVPKWLAKGV
jgi:putative transposase